MSGVGTSKKFSVSVLSPKQSCLERIHIDFGDSKKVSEWSLESCNDNKLRNSFKLEAPMGEQLEPILLSEAKFVNLAAGLSGMSEYSAKLGRRLEANDLYQVANCAPVERSQVRILVMNLLTRGRRETVLCFFFFFQVYFCAQTRSKKQVVLIILHEKQVTVHSENIVLGSILCTDISSFSD